MTRVVVGELLLAGALEPVVELLAQAGAELVDERAGVEARIRATDAAEEQSDVAEVRLHRVRDPRVLHLHRDRAPVVRDGTVHLSDRRRRDRLGIELGEDPIGRRAELTLDRSRPRARRSSAARPAGAARGPSARAPGGPRRGS